VFRIGRSRLIRALTVICALVPTVSCLADAGTPGSRAGDKRSGYDTNCPVQVLGRGQLADAQKAKLTPLERSREGIRRQIHSTCDEARADVFNYIETFYNFRRRHNTAGDL